MKLRILLPVAIAFLSPYLLASSCDSNGCEKALEQTKKLTREICDGEPEYGSTPFCSVCVKAGRLSTTGPTACECTLLAFDQGVCTYPTDDDAKASIRSAMRWANESCRTFTIPDGGSGGASGGNAEPGAGDAG